MQIKDIIIKSSKPAIYELGSAFMWTDKYISKQILNIHLNEDIDLGSRKMSTIIKTTDWILSLPKQKKKLSILDLGCGPGLYTEILAREGHQVTGIDISENSIEYARRSAIQKGLDIEYINSSYIDIELEKEKYDLIILIYTDLGVLVPNKRNTLLKKVYSALKKDGLFVFDLASDKNMEQKVAPKSWEAAESGFWKPSPYLALSESFLYKKQKVILFQHTIADEEENIETYRFWTHLFSEEDILNLLNQHHFIHKTFRRDILPEGDIWSGDHVIFTVASK